MLSLAEVYFMWPLTVIPFTEMCGRRRGRGRKTCGRQNVRVRTSLGAGLCI